MAKYLVETYLSRAGRPTPEELSRSAREVSLEGKEVRLLESIFIPADETCFYLFEAQSGDDVVEVATRSGLQMERVMDAVAESVTSV